MSSLLAQTAVVLFAPVVLPRLYRFFRSLRSDGQRMKPPSALQRASVLILLLVAVIAITSTLPWFRTENIVKLTKGRLLQTPNDVLTRRLEKLRNQNGYNLTAGDIQLLGRMGTKEGRLLYATFGPDPLIKCLWCRDEDPSAFLIYSLPGIVLIHLLHTAILGIVTSRVFSKASEDWRTHATVAGLTLAIAEVVALWSHDIYSNTRIYDAGKVVWYHWDLRFYRGIGIAIVDVIFGALLYLGPLGSPITDSERIENAMKAGDVTLGMVRAGVFFKYAAMEDQVLRDSIVTFWFKKGNEKSQILSDDETMAAMRVESERVDIDNIIKEAQIFTDNMMQDVKNVENHL